MRKPVTEHSTTIKARKGGPQQSSRLEAVGGGQVRRVEFEGERPVVREEPPAPTWRPRSDDSIDQIHFEIDNLERTRRGAPPRVRRTSERRVFETDRGTVKEARVDTAEGERRVLYTSRVKGSRQQEQRFHSGLVDRVLARSGQGPSFSSVEEEPRRGLLSRRRKEETRPPAVKSEPPATPAKKADAASKPAAKAKSSAVKKAAAPVAKKVAAPVAKETGFQPQCEAVTQAGMQCRNSAKSGSHYCGSHQSYKPQRLETLLDTKPSRGKDTLPGAGDLTGTGQCAAYTQQGVQCRNSSRKSSKYCASHKGYRPPTKASLEKRLDTKPRHAGAKDTTPRMRR